ncbi:DNA damage-regulated autophagy modulator protein 2 [Nymphon striatum]|nr:DNA damage-regulated autophagy modulator protein 2 [Nymphon striatum]
MATSRIYMLPLSVFILLPTTFAITYVIAVCLKHVEVDFPYISDTGTFVPESCIFGQLLNIVAFLLALTLYVRYRLIHKYWSQFIFASARVVNYVNTASFVFGCLGALGLSIVANFQETSLEKVHITGALLAFSMGVVYIKMHSYMSWKMAPVFNSKRMAKLRIFISFFATCAFMISTICSYYSKLKFHGTDKTKWYPKDGGWHLHVAATAAEWLLAVAFSSYILTFVHEFKKVRISMLDVILHELDASGPSMNASEDTINFAADGQCSFPAIS